MTFDIELEATNLEIEFRKRIAALAGNQARVALLGIALGKELDESLEIAESYPPGKELGK